MATIHKNEKGFKVIHVSGREMLKIGCGNVCDHCGEQKEDGYYVAVLNRWFCTECYNDWYEGAINYAEFSGVEEMIENNNFIFFGVQLGFAPKDLK